MRLDPRMFAINYDRTPAQLRRGGFFLVPLGLLISLIGAGMLALALGAQIPAEWLPGSIRIEPRTTPWETPVGLVVLLSVVLCFGLLAIAEGLWRIFLGRMNVTLLRIMLGIVAALCVAGFIASGLLGKRFGQVGQ